MNDSLNVSMTEAAARRIRDYLAKSPQAVGFRFGVEKTGCSGWAYVVSLADEIDESDHMAKVDGLTVIVDDTSLPIVNGTKIDFVRRGINHIFVFNNPNAEAECGCGESFTISEATA
ncbi:MAG: hypothetical protein DHS20C11_17650 [Lysobacteraceae bacterium]|nr:MAG: hypothetical protein DHS20C11_17650 [Xanthomonadaceae bacterium]